MFFVLVGVLAIIGLASLLGVTISSALAVTGAVVLIPILLFKLFLIFAFVGFMGRAWHRGDRSDWGRRGRSRRRPQSPQPSTEDRFEDWHRIAHAKEEVDSWAPQPEE